MVKGHESNCKGIKEEISIEKAEQERAATAMQWISSFDFQGAFTEVLETTGINGVYKDRAQYVLEHEEFQSWYSPGESSVLWLRGTIGTGKSTLMARTVLEVSSSDNSNPNPRTPPAIFFFDKVKRADATSVEVCLRSLTRQLSWDHATSTIELAADEVYNKWKDVRKADKLTAGECLNLLKELLDAKEAYIMIDAIDECESPTVLLERLVALQNSLKGDKSLHIMLCGRMKPNVKQNFQSCLVITTGPDASSMDQDFYVNTEIELRRPLSAGSVFFSSEKNFPGRLKDVLTRRAQGLFRWIEIQIDVFTRTDFNWDSELETQLKRIEQTTLDPDSTDVFSKEYDRLLNDLGKHKDSQKFALNMLRFIACSFWPLSAVALADAINASNPGLGVNQLTANDVNRLLVGFVRDVSTDTAYQKFRHVQSAIGLQLAHASVIEYLIDNKTVEDAGRFAAPDQHAEATKFCLAVISQRPQLGWDTSMRLAQTHGQDIYRQSMSDIIYYSCFEWPQHCKAVFATEGNSDLAARVRNFLMSDSHVTWNHAVAELLLNLQRDPRYSSSKHIVDHVRQNAAQAKPGFVIAACDITELLNDPDMQRHIDLSNLNAKHDTLLFVSLRCSKQSILKRLLEIYPEEVPWDGSPSVLIAAVDSRLPEAVERLMESCRTRRRTDPSYGRSITLALAIAVRFSLPKYRLLTVSENDCDDSAALSDIIKQLLVHGANLFATDTQGYGIMHFANIVFVQKLLIDHAKVLEAKGLRGSVQRLLRIRNTSGQTPVDVSKQKGLSDLEDELNRAVENDDKQVMYDFENIIDIPILRSNPQVGNDEFLSYLLLRDGAQDLDRRNIFWDHAFREYIEWLAHRALELKTQYLSEQHQIASNFQADSLVQELPDKWDRSEERIEDSRYRSTFIVTE
jgi:hypothetical protein